MTGREEELEGCVRDAGFAGEAMDADTGSTLLEAHGRAASAHRLDQTLADNASGEQHEAESDDVTRQSISSFPASDPPSWSSRRPLREREWPTGAAPLTQKGA